MEKVRKVVKKINIEGRKELLMIDITADESMVIVGSNAGGMVAIGGVTDIVGLVGVSTAVEGVITEPFGLVVGATIDVELEGVVTEPSVGSVTEPLETVGSVGGSNVRGIVSS